MPPIRLPTVISGLYQTVDHHDRKNATSVYAGKAITRSEKSGSRRIRAPDLASFNIHVRVDSVAHSGDRHEFRGVMA